MTDLRTTYLGLELASPVVASAGPLTGHVHTLRALADAGAAAVVLPSLFEEEVEAAVREYELATTAGADAFAEALTYLPAVVPDPTGLDAHVRLVEEAKQALDIPVVASLNGVSTGGWTAYARVLAEAGADALELNVYAVAADVDDRSADVEQRVVDLVATVRETVSVPLAVKLSPYYTASAHLAHRLVGAGADGLVLFNRFYQPDIDVDALTVEPTLSLSSSADLLVPLRWIALLAGRVPASLAASGGVHSPADVAKVLLAGADVAMTTSAVLRHGPGHVRTLLDGLRAWMVEHEYASVAELRGSMSAGSVADADAYERAAYVATIRRHTAQPVPAPPPAP